MNKQVSNKMATSSFILIVGGLVCKFIGAFYRIPLSNLLGAEGIGMYQIIFPLYSFTLVLVSGAMPLAVSKLTSKALALKNNQQITRYFFASFVFSAGFSALVALAFFVLASPLSQLQGTQSAYLSYYLVGGSVFFAALIACYRGLFQGYSHMSSTVISQVIEQVVKLVAGLLFAYFLLHYGTGWAVVGAFLALFLSELIAFFYYLVLSVVKIKRKTLAPFKLKGASFAKSLKQVLSLAFPVTLSQLMMPLAFGLQSLFIIKLLTSTGLQASVAKSHFGILSGMVNSIVSFPSVISVSLGVILVPSISFLIAKNNKQEANQVVKKFYLTLWIIALPCTVGYFMLADNIIAFVFSAGIEKQLLPLASRLLKIASLQILFVSFVQVTTVLLQTVNKTWRAFLSLFCFFVVCSGLSFLLTYNFGIVGLAVANLLAYSITCLINVFLIKKEFDTKFKLSHIFSPILLSGLMGVFIHLFKLFFATKLPEIWFLIICILISVVFYFGFLLIFKVINVKDFFANKKINN